MGRDTLDFSWQVGADNAVRVYIPAQIAVEEVEEIQCFLEMIRCRVRRLAGLPYEDVATGRERLSTGLTDRPKEPE